MAKKIIKKKAVKKVVRKKVVAKKPASSAGKEKKVGKVTHYFSGIKVAVIKLSDSLKVGDNIRIVGGEDTDFKQQVKSIQLDHKSLKSAKKGKSVGLKVSKKAREGYIVYKI